MMTMTYTEDQKNYAIHVVSTERDRWEDATCYVTEKVGFRMRELIRTLRKNFWGVFDVPRDPATGRAKTWIPLPMRVVEDYVKNINMGQKDIGFRASNPNGYKITDLTRAVVRNYLDKMNFGEIMDETDRQLCIDGTVVWKTWETRENGKPVLNRKTVDLLNFYIDPTEDNIQSAYRVTERAMALPEQVSGMTGWADTQNIQGSQSLNRNDAKRNSGGTNQTTGDYTDVWETWGKIQRWVVTGNKKAKDAMEEIDGHIVISGLESGDLRVHLIEENKKTDKLGNVIKPYEELRDSKITGRWYGLGRVERILALTEWLNITGNIRISRSYVSQLGLFKIRKNSGITPQMIQKLPVNGAVPVNDMDDIQQMPIADVPLSSYKDEEVIKDWATAVTSAYPISAGGDVPASQTATASAIQNTQAKTAFTATKEAKGFFMKRWFDRHALPIIAKTITTGDIIKLSGDDELFKEVLEKIIASSANEALNNDFYSRGLVPSDLDIRTAIDAAERKLRKKGELFIEAVQEIVAKNLDTHVYFTNEDLDTAVTVQNLIQMVGIAPEYRESTIKQIYDLMGLDQPRKQEVPEQPEMPQMQGMSEMPPNLQEQTLMANA